MKNIEYQQGERIGECFYFNEAKPYTSPKGRLVRMAAFLCMQCTSVFIARIDDVKNRKTVSCGCYKSGLMKNKMTTHGLRYHPLHSTWLNMKSRCYNPKNQDYKYYGGRGIIVCDVWKNDFKVFYDYVTRLPNYGKEGMTIDRENNEGNYEPNNLRWADAQTQRLNQRRNYEKAI